MDLTQLLAPFLILFVAAVTQAVTGFGFSLVSVPLLALVSGPRVAVVGSSVVAQLLTSTTALHERREITWRPVGIVLATSAVGMPVGLYALARLPVHILTAGIAGVVLTLAAMTWRGLRFAGGVPAFAAVGAVCGALATSTGMNGPPLVAALQAMGYPPRPFRATLAAIFVGSGVLGVLGFAVTGQVTRSAAVVALAGAPAVLAGWYLGDAVFAKVSVARFRRIVLLALAATSVITLAAALR